MRSWFCCRFNDLADRLSFLQHQPQCFRGRFRLAGVSVRIHAFWKQCPVTGYACGRKFIGYFCGHLVTGFVAIESDDNFLWFTLFNSFKKLISKSIYPVSCRNVRKAVSVERQGIYDRFTEYYFISCQAFRVEDSGVWAGQIEMVSSASSEVVSDLSAVDFADVAAFIEDRKHDRAGKMFVAAVAIKAEFLQLSSDFKAAFYLLNRQIQAESSVRKAELKSGDYFRVVYAALFEICDSFRAGFKGFMVIVYYLQH